MIKGPSMNPRIPNKKSPPIIPIKIKAECMLVLLETIKGLMKLSDEEEIRPKIRTPTAANMCPEIIR